MAGYIQAITLRERMRKMKAAKSLISLTLCMAIPLSAAVYTITPGVFSDVDAGLPCFAAAERLNRLNIIAGYKDGKFKPNGYITRAEMAKIICAADGLGARAQTDTAFLDVPESHWASGYIAAADKLGFLSGNGDGTFSPENNVTYEQAVKMAMSLLGYDAAAEEKGGYPAGYLAVAANTDVLYGVRGNTGDPMRRGDIAILVSNALDTPIMAQVNDNGKLSYQAQDGRAGVPLKTLITEKFSKDTAKADNMSLAVKVLDLLRQRKDLKGRNIMYSPFSLKTAFMMIANGAEGDTLKEILSVFGVDDLKAFNNFISAQKTLSNPANPKFTLNIANSIWLNKDMYPGLNIDFAPRFKKDTLDYFGAAALTVDDKTGAGVINKWISDKTKGRIDNVISGSEQKDTLLCLVNAIYFKADWQNTFAMEATRPDIFTDQDNTARQTEFMHRESNFNYYEDSDLQMLEMPYDQSRSMYVFLPVSGDLGSISSDRIENAIRNKSGDLVDVSIPKFKTETTLDLTDIMKTLGVTKAFDSNRVDLKNKMVAGLPADLTVYLNMVKQKSFIQVDEKGTEAAAATVAMHAPGYSPNPNPPKPKVFNADHPFVYLIRDNDTGTVYFFGQYSFVE